MNDKDAYILENSRKTSYIIIAVTLTLLYMYLRGSDWQGTKNLHTVMESLSTVLAWMVGITSLIRFYSNKQEYLYLFIGAGFMGTGFLDAYHAIVTSSFFDSYFPSPSESLIPWSWIASRLYLSVLLCLGWYYWFTHAKNVTTIDLNEKKVYIITVITTLLTFLFFAFVPLPRAYYDEYFFHRPEEFIPAIFFFIALVGFYKKGSWKSDYFEHWLVIALVVNLVSQVVFMSFSGHLFDMEFDSAHFLKKVSYICVLVGLYFSMFNLFQKADNMKKILEDKVKIALQENTSKTERLEILTKNLELEVSKKTYDLVNSNKKYKVLLDRFDENVIASRTNIKGIITYVTKAFCKISGYPKNELMGHNHRIVRHPDMKKELYVELWQTIKNGKTFIGEIKNKKKDGSFYWVRVIITPELNENNKITSYFAIREDITLKKEIEVFNETLEKKVDDATKDNRKKDELLAQQSKLAAMGEMMGNIAHQWRQPLNALAGNIQFLKEDFEDELIDEKFLDEYIKTNMEFINFMSKTIDDFRNFFRVDKIKKDFEIKTCVDKPLSILRPQLKELNINLNVSGDNFVVNALQSELQQVILNIVNNARDALEEKKIKNGTIEVKTYFNESTGTIIIEDNAGGIPNDIINRVFEPYYTTKEQGKGTGIGLYMSKTIIEDNMQGELIVSNTLTGARFEINLQILKNAT